MDFERVGTVIGKECGLEKNRTVTVGVSGGADSLCLTSILHELEFPLIVAHVNHQLRPESNTEEQFVREFAAGLDAPFFSRRVDVETYAREKKISIEESARYLRYTFLFEVAAETNSQALAVAHQADDQVETVIMHLLRGAGPSGLKGMAYRSNLPFFSTAIPVVRPLLGVWREEIDEYCRQHGINACMDQTNTDPGYFRNRIRLELLPYLASYNPQAKGHIWQMSQLMQDENLFIEEEAERKFAEIMVEQGDGFVILDAARFTGLAVALQRRVMRRILSTLRSDLRDIGYEAVEKGCACMRQERVKGEVQLMDEVFASAFSGGKVLIALDSADFSQVWPQLADEAGVRLEYPGTTILNDNWQVAAEVIDGTNSIPQDLNADAVWFDLEALKGDLHFRPVRPGERIQPFGEKEFAQKVSDLFINSGVHRKARKRWPILYCSDDLLWVTSVRRSRLAPVTVETKRVLVLKLQRK